MKKKLPLQVLQTLEPLVVRNSSLFEIIEPGEFLLKFSDKDPKSDFFSIY